MAKDESKETVLQDEKDLEKSEETTAEVWSRRFTEAEEFRQPYDARNLRMYKLYRAYRGWNGNYGYKTNLMPPIGFEVIETIKPRLAASKVNVRILPTKKEDVNNPTLKKWDNLIEYYFQSMDFHDKKMDWIDAQLKYGNGIAQVTWEGEGPELEICDNWLTYADPQAKRGLNGARWIIKQSWKEKEIIEKEEQEREDEERERLNKEKEKEFEARVEAGEPIEDIEKEKKEHEKDESKGESGRLYDKEALNRLENESVEKDPRRDRDDVTTLKMGQIDDGVKRDSSTDAGSGEGKRSSEEYKGIELLECYDFVKQELVTIGNRTEVLRKEDNPYKDINEKRNPGNTFIDLACIAMPWEFHAMPILEPIETTICEIADSRNQAMDNIIYNLDPIRKIKRNKGYKNSDFKTAPGAMWMMDSTDDVIIERPPDISNQWIDKDEILRREIQTSLALSEYTQGMPQSSQEPMGKVELLLMQTNIRFSMLVRKMENAFEELVNILIEMSQEFLHEDKAFRIVGEDFEFDEFTEQDKEVYIDAKVDIIPKREKTPEQEVTETRELHEMFVMSQQPDPNDEQAMYKWKKRKAEMEKLILEKMGYEEYIDLLVEEPEEPQPQQEPQAEQAPAPGMEEALMGTPPGGTPQEAPMMMEPPVTDLQQSIPEKEPILPPEEAMMPGATTGITEPSPNILERLMQRFNK